MLKKIKKKEKFARNKSYLADNNSFGADLENSTALKFVLAA